MKTILRPALAALLLASVVEWAAAQETTFSEKQDNIGYGTKAGEFLLLPAGGRGAALGQAFTAIADDATALYWNPAGIGFLRQGSAHVSRLDYLVGTSYTWAGVALPVGTGTWVVGAQFGGFDFGEAPVTTVAEPEGTGSFYDNSMFVGGATLAMNVTDRFTVGVSGKFIQESFANTRGSTFAADFGTNYHTLVAGRPFRAAFSILNLGGELQMDGSDLDRTVTEQDPKLPDRQDQSRLETQSFALPVMFKVGLAWEAISAGSSGLWLTGEFWQPQQNNTSGAFGAEYMLRPADGTGFMAALRGGFTYEPDRSLDLGGRDFGDEGSDGLAFGGGIGYRAAPDGLAIMLDYAFRDQGLLGNTNLFSISLSW